MTRHVSFQKLLLEAVGEAVYCLDREGNTIFVNAVAEELLGWKEEELLGKSIHSLVHRAGPDSGACESPHCRIAPSFHPLIPCQGIEMFRTKNGRRIRVKFVVAPMIEQGRMSGAIIAFHAAPRRFKAEPPEQAAADAGGRRDGTEFLADASCRIRNCLDEIARMAETVAQSEVTAEQRACLDAVQLSNESIRQIVNEMDSFASVEEAEAVPEKSDPESLPGDAVPTGNPPRTAGANAAEVEKP